MTETGARPSLVPVGPAHAAVLAALHQACFEDSPWHRPWPEPEMAQLLTLPGVAGWLAMPGDAPDTEPVGLVLVQQAGPEADVLTLGVRPRPWRRRGLGGLMMARAEAALQARGADRLFLEVSEDNATAVCFYAARGYAVVGRRPGYYAALCAAGTGRTADALVMVRDLA